MANGQDQQDPQNPRLQQLLQGDLGIPEGVEQLPGAVEPAPSRGAIDRNLETLLSGDLSGPLGAGEDDLTGQDNQYSILERLNIFSPAAREKVASQIDSLRQLDDITVSALSALGANPMAPFKVFVPTTREAEVVGNAILSAVDYAVRALVPDTEENKQVSRVVLESGEQIGEEMVQTLTNPREAFEERGLLAVLDVADIAAGAGLVGALGKGAIRSAAIRRSLKEGGENVLADAVSEAAEGVARRKALPPGPVTGPVTDVVTDRQVAEQARQRLQDALKTLREVETRPSGLSPGQIRRERLGAGLTGPLPGPDSIPTKIGAAQRRIGRIDEADRQVAKAAYEAVTRGRSKRPSFVMLPDAPQRGALLQLTDEIPPLSAMAPVDALDNRIGFLRGALGIEPEQMRRINSAIHGNTSMPKTAGAKRRLAEYLDRIGRGQQPIPASRREILSIRRRFGKEAVEAGADDPVRRMRDSARRSQKAGDPVDDAIRPSPAHTADVRDVGLIGFVMDFSDAVPEARAILRPALRARNDEMVEMSERFARMAEGIKPGSKIDRQVAEILDGRHGNTADVIAGRVKAPVSRRAIEVAGETREILDDLFARLKVSNPDLNYVSNYLTWLRDEYASPNLIPADLVRNTGRKVWNKYVMSRSGAPAPEDISFVESMSAYIPAALKSIHLNPALKQLDALEDAWRALDDAPVHKIALIDMQRDVLLGTPSRWEKIVDTSIVRTVERLNNLPGVDLDVGVRPAMRMSLMMANGFYRGVLGLNVSAALNNMTQSVNTMAKAGVFPTIEGMGKMVFSKQARHAAEKADLSRQFARLFEENRRFGKLKGTFDDVLFAPFNFAEFFNRGVAYHAGASKALRKGASPSKAAEAGLKMAQETQFVYDEISRSPIFRGPLGRQFGVLTSFPIKQATFLGKMAKDEKLSLVRYFLVTGSASVALEKGLGVKMHALADANLGPVPLPPGFEFATQLEGAPLAVGPFGQLLEDGFSMLRGMAEQDSVATQTHTQRFLDGVTDMVPAAVQGKELLSFFGDWLESVRRGEEIKRRRIVPGGPANIPGVGEVPGGANVPFIREAFGARGDLQRGDTSVGEEILAMAGIQQVDQDERFEAGRAFARYLSEDRDGKGSAADLASGMIARDEEIAEVKALMKREEVSDQSLRSSQRFRNKDLFDRLMESSSTAQLLGFLEEHPEYIEFAPRGVQVALQRRAQRQR